MKLIDKLLVFTGKKDFKIDEKISIAYIMRVCWKYGWMMIRGRIFSIGRRNISNNIFVGKHVQVLEKDICIWRANVKYMMMFILMLFHKME